MEESNEGIHRLEKKISRFQRGVSSRLIRTLAVSSSVPGKEPIPNTKAALIKQWH